MTVLLPPTWVTIAPETLAPRLRVEGPGTVTYPGNVLWSIYTELGVAVRAVVTDAQGNQFLLGTVAVAPDQRIMVIGTAHLVGGTASVTFTATDAPGRSAVVERTLVVNRNTPLVTLHRRLA